MRVLIISAHFKRAFFEKMMKHMKRVEARIIPSEWWQGKTSLFNMRKEILTFKPDLIYTDDTLSTTVISKLTNKQIPVLIHLRGNWWIEFWDKIRWSWRHRLIAPLNYTVTTASFRLADGFIPICKWLDEEVHRRYPTKGSRVVYQGVDPSLFYPEEGMQFDHPCVGIVQDHNIPAKVQGLLQFREVVQRLPKVTFKIAGGGPYLERVRTHFKDEKNVEIIGRIPYPHGLRQFLTAVDLYVLASGLDCCPTTVLEASLMKKPVLASAIGGVPEIVLQGKTGWTIPNEKTKEWTDKIQLLLDDKKKAKRIGNNGRKWASENFNWEKITEQVEDVCISMTEKR